jgi:hypothetical protein
MKNTKGNAKKYLLKNGRMISPMSDYNAEDVISLMYGYAEHIKNCNIPHVSNSLCNHPFNMVVKRLLNNKCLVCGEILPKQNNC